MQKQAPIFTIGHSTHSMFAFLDILKLNSIEAIADVRSAPFSRIAPHFNREILRSSLEAAGIHYVFLGDKLGGRSMEADDFQGTRVVYDRLRRNPGFIPALERVIVGSETFRIALMCSEKEPLDCHRFLLLSTELSARNMKVFHLLADGSSEPHEYSLSRLLQKFGMDEPDLFRSNNEVLSEVLARQEERIAFTLGDSKKGRIGTGQLGTDRAGEEFS